MTRLLFILAVHLFALSGVHAQDVSGIAERTASALRSDLERIRAEIALPTVTDKQLVESRRQLDDIRIRATAEVEKLAAPIADLTQQIDKLGPKPADPATESEATASQRVALNNTLANLQSIKSQFELLAVEADQVSGRASSIQREQFFARVFERDRSILNPSLWVDSAVGLGLFVQRLQKLFVNWRTETAESSVLPGLLILLAGIALLGGLFAALRRRLGQWLGSRSLSSRTPNEMERLWRIVGPVLLTILAVLFLAVLVAVSFDASGLLTPRLQLIFNAVFSVMLKTAAYAVFAQKLAAPGNPAWRIIALDEMAARRFPLLFALSAFVIAMTAELQKLTDSLFLPVSNTIGQSAISAAIMVVLLTLMLLSFRRSESVSERSVGSRTYYFGWMVPFTPVAWLLIGLAAIALLFGYVALASYIVRQLFETVVLVSVLFLLHHLSDEVTANSLDPASAVGRFLRGPIGLGETAIARTGLLFRTAVDLLLVVIGLPLLFLQWTVTWVDFRSIFNSAFLGFRIGDITVSPRSVILVVLILSAGIILTNLVIRWLDSRILSASQISRGVQDSISKTASYAGYILAAGFALSAAGLDFSNLALVAGALGIGIGLGLQSIVNNFVSGLILLAERPIRQGDWIAFSAGEGIVKRINVRATQIETFDRCTIVVPNSVLITEPVRNWTYGDAGGRFTVSVTVEYGNDPQVICKILKDIANENRAVLSDPPAIALLTGFSDRGMNFELKANVADVFESVFVASDIRMAIDRAFKERGIEISSMLPMRPTSPTAT